MCSAIVVDAAFEHLREHALLFVPIDDRRDEEPSRFLALLDTCNDALQVLADALDAVCSEASE